VLCLRRGVPSGKAGGKANPEWEEAASVAAAVQNMALVAAATPGVGELL
jgi:hypothetical protein